MMMVVVMMMMVIMMMDGTGGRSCRRLGQGPFPMTLQEDPLRSDSLADAPDGEN